VAYALTPTDIKDAKKYVRWVCQRYGVVRWQDIEEIENLAMLNMLMATGRYRGDGGATFITYVRKRLWGTVVDYLRYLKKLSVEICETDLQSRRISLHNGSQEFAMLNGLSQIPEQEPKPRYSAYKKKT